MIQIISYEVEKSILTVGFKVDDFVVYSSIGYDSKKTKQQLLQLAYEQIKQTIDYEKKLNEPSITSDKVGEEFIPNEPELRLLRLLVDNDYIQFEEGQENAMVSLSTISKDQYNENIEVDIEITTTLGTIKDNILTIPTVEEFAEATITASVGDITCSKVIEVYPYVEPQPSEVDILDNRIVDVERTLDIILGGEDNE